MGRHFSFTVGDGTGPIRSDLRGRGDVPEKRKRKIVYPGHRHLEMFNDEDDYPSIASMISLEEAIYQKGPRCCDSGV